MVEMEGEEVTGLLGALYEWLMSEIIIIDNLVSFVVLVVLAAAVYFLRGKISAQGKTILSHLPGKAADEAILFWQEIYKQLTLILLIGIYNTLGAVFAFPVTITAIAGYLLTAWLIIRFIAWFLPDNIWVEMLTYLVWIVAVLNILGIYDMVVSFLEDVKVNLGELELSVMLVIQGVLVFMLLFWGAGWLEKYFRRNLRKNKKITPSVRVLLQKVIRIVIYAVAFFIGLSSIGVDLSAFAFIGGAVGVGLGFGLQKIVSNFISGIIIIMDRSIKPGDVVEIDEVFGEVRSLNSRFVSVVTRSGKEFLIPNEHFITNKVINWSYSDDLVRIDLKVGVGYNSDLKLVKELMLDAAKGKNRVVKRPAPVCLLRKFGDNTVNFELRFWIRDPENGVENIKSQMKLEIWELFQQNGINIAFPQRDLHLESISEEAAEKIKEICREDNDGSN